MSYTIRSHYLVLFALIVCANVLYYSVAMTTPAYKSDGVHRLLWQGSLTFITLSLTYLYCLYLNRQPYIFPVTHSLKRPAATFAALVSIYFFASVLIAYLVLQAFPNSGDEYDYVFQGMTFSSGRLWNDPPIAPDFFKVPWMIIKDNKWTTQYDPGWPSVLALSMIAGLPAWLVGPLVGGFSLIAFICFVRHVEDDVTALLCATACAATPFYLFNTASYFSHGLAGLLALLFVYFTVRHLETGSEKSAVLAGIFLGALGATRMYSAVLCLLPVLFTICKGGVKHSLTKGFWFGLGGLPFVTALMVYNWAVTGNPLTPVKSWGYPYPELYPFVSLWTEGGLPNSIFNTALYVFESGEYVWPIFAIMYCSALGFKIRTKTVRFYDWYALIFVLGFLAFAADAGNRYGPRYYFEAFPFAILTVCSATVELVRSRRHPLRGAVAAHLLASQLIVAAVTIPFMGWLNHNIITERTDLFRKVANAKIDNAIVFVKDRTGVISSMMQRDLLRNGVDLSGNVIYAIDRGTKNGALLDHFPDREIWLYKREDDTREGTLKKLPPPLALR